MFMERVNISHLVTLIAQHVLTDVIFVNTARHATFNWNQGTGDVVKRKQNLFSKMNTG